MVERGTPATGGAGCGRFGFDRRGEEWGWGKISSLLVISRNSTFAFKGKAVDVHTVGRELNVRYLQDDITSNVVSALHVRLVEGEQARVWHRGTKNFEGRKVPWWQRLAENP